MSGKEVSSAVSIAKVFSRFKVRALCRSLEFFQTNLVKPCLYGFYFVHRGMIMLDAGLDLFVSVK